MIFFFPRICENKSVKDDEVLTDAAVLRPVRPRNREVVTCWELGMEGGFCGFACRSLYCSARTKLLLSLPP